MGRTHSFYSILRVLFILVVIEVGDKRRIK
jgi:hypothetical protein